MREYDLYTVDGEMIGGFTDIEELEEKADNMGLTDYKVVVSVVPDPPLRVFFYGGVAACTAHDRSEAIRLLEGLFDAQINTNEVEEIDLSKPYALRLS